MVFHSINYLFFFAAFVLIYYLVPPRYRYVPLLLGSYFFYACQGAAFIGFLLYITLVTYLAALAARRFLGKGKSRVLTAVSACLTLAPLLFLKGTKAAVPVGLSFYTFQALGYVFDVERGKTPVEKNLPRYAAFVSFFPNLLSGPIERADRLLTQIRKGAVWNLEKVRRGLLEIAWGLFLKVVCANHISQAVDPIFDHFSNYRGIEFAIATGLFAIQIYCDFAGYSLMAIGSARVLSIDLADNFRLPYFSDSTGEFWRRWHISLTGWFRDYLYIPLGGNRKGTFRKYLNTMIVFVVSGLWHGVSWGFVFWGALNGLFVVLGDLKKKLRKTKRVPRVVSVLLTFVLVDYAWLFFRADSLRQGFAMTKAMLVNFYPAGLSGADVIREFGGTPAVLFLAAILLFLFLVDFLQDKTGDLIGRIFRLPLAARWGIYLGLLFLIIVFGIYGYSYEQTQFIYFDF